MKHLHTREEAQRKDRKLTPGICLVFLQHFKSHIDLNTTHSVITSSLIILGQRVSKKEDVAELWKEISEAFSVKTIIEGHVFNSTLQHQTKEPAASL